MARGIKGKGGNRGVEGSAEGKEGLRLEGGREEKCIKEVERIQLRWREEEGVVNTPAQSWVGWGEKRE